MNFKRLYIILIAAPMLLIAAFANAQGVGGSISGKLVDAANGQPLEFATVSLINKADNKPFRSTQTALGGNFNITGVPNGTYIFRATFVGYISFSKDSIAISGSPIQLGSVKLKTAKGVLKEVQVTAQRSQIQISTDKKVFSVDQSLVSQGGSATDLLSNVPSVQVDVDGNINLRGSSDVRILINGKPSALTGANLADILQSIPASSIENIEVITNPSSKYDAEGQSGIINIVLKRNAQVGFNGSVSATAGTQHTYNTSLNLAYQTEAVNIYSNYSFRKGTRIGNGSSHTVTMGTTGTTTQDQVADQSFNITSNNIRSGIDVYPDKKTTLSFTNNINLRSNDRLQNGFTNLSGPGIIETITRNNNSTGSGHNLDFNLDLNHKYKKPQQELTANIGYSTAKNNNNDNLNTGYAYTLAGQLPGGYSSLQNNINMGNQHNLNLQADYVLPLTNGRLEMGYRSTFNKTDNNYTVDTLNQTANRFVRADTLGNLFTYNEQVHALYTNFQHAFGKFSFQAGLRAEDAHITTQTTVLNRIENHNQDYFRLYPSVFLTDKLSENQTLQLSYSRRVSRPRDRQISPFLDRSDRQNYQQGNPNLKPEDTHSIELSYINYYKTLTLTSSLYYRKTLDDIQRIQTLYPGSSTITLTTFDNVSSASNGGYELIAKLTPSKIVDLTDNVNVYYRSINGDASQGIRSSSGTSFNGNLTANIKPLPKLGFQIRGDYQGKQVTAQGTQNSLYGVDGGLKYDITKTLNFSANARDIFNTRKFSNTVVSSDGRLNQFSERRFATRIVLFTLAYRFGQSVGGNRQKKKDQKNDDQQDNSPDDLNPNNGGGGNAAGGGTQTAPPAAGAPQAHL